MEKFNPSAKCVKCGSDNISNTFREKGERYANRASFYNTAKCDLIRSYCRGCGYRWSSLPLDAENEQDECCKDYKQCKCKPHYLRATSVYAPGATAASIITCKNCDRILTAAEINLALSERFW